MIAIEGNHCWLWAMFEYTYESNRGQPLLTLDWQCGHVQKPPPTFDLAPPPCRVPCLWSVVFPRWSHQSGMRLSRPQPLARPDIKYPKWLWFSIKLVQWCIKYKSTMSEQTPLIYPKTTLGKLVLHFFLYSILMVYIFLFLWPLPFSLNLEKNGIIVPKM